MAESAVSFLLEQLSVLLRDERKLLGGLKHEVESINDELVYLKEFLRVADGKEESDPNLKEWIRQLREISFDVQDVLDQYMLRFGRRRATNGLISKRVVDPIKNLKARHQIASEIKALKLRLESIVKTQQRYRDMYAIIGQGSSSGEDKEYDGRGDALFLEEDEVVGIENSKKQLLEWIRLKDSGLEVISVVGTGGLGKTTLVKQVYDDVSVKSCFDRHVWVTVSDYKDDVKHLLMNLIKKLKEEIRESPPQGLQDMTIDDMRFFLYEFLKENKYMIVLDDVWKLTTWEVIRSALPRKDSHGCIIITTRSRSIGDAACSETDDHVYELQALSSEESEALFFKKAFSFSRNVNTSCPPHLRGLADSILKRCEGLPLAIVVIGGLLATKKNKIHEWELFSRSLSHESLSGNNLDRLWKSVFSLSYNDLPYYLKYCFLYLSIFPQGGLLQNDQIIKLWIVEGFVQQENDKILEKTANEYMNELYSRNLIQVAKSYGDGTPWAFRIHDLLRGYITSKSREHNIATVHDGGEKQWPNKIRRLVIQNPLNSNVESHNFQHLRSLLLSNGGVEVGKIKEILSKCKLLKVLDLEGSPLEAIPDEVFKLYQLKYLSLRNTMVKLLPKSIKNLENLEMLDLTDTNVTELPAEITELQRLQHLFVCRYNDPNYVRTSKLSFDNVQSFKAPHGIGSCLQSLQALYYVDGGIEMVREIGMLTNLRDLRIAKVRSEDGKTLCSSIANLTNLRLLQIYSTEEDEKLELDYSISSTSLPFLTSLTLNGYLERVPQWIPSLHALNGLTLGWCKLKEDPLNSLQDLPNLTYLRIHDACVEGLSFKARGFPKLKKLELCELKMMKWVMVENGCMPSVEEWIIIGCMFLADLPQGIEHLTNLEYLDFRDMPDEYRKRADEEKRSHGDSWRLARVCRVSFGTLMDGSWSFVAL